MNSQTPTPAEGQQPANPSDAQSGSGSEPRQEPRTEPQSERPAESRPAAAGPVAAGAVAPGAQAATQAEAPAESTAESTARRTEKPTEQLFPHFNPTQEIPGTPPPGGPGFGGPGTPPPGGPGFGAGRPGDGRPDQQLNFFDWIRSHGIYRGRDRWIGGVSSGIAERMGIDSLIVRGVFIVLTLFAGIGVLLYGVAWALLPEPDGRIHTQEAAAGRWTSGMTGALITTIIGLTGMGGGFWGWGHDGFGFFWALFWVGGVIYLIYFLTQRNKNRIGEPMNTTQAGAAYGYAAAGGAPAAGSFPAGTQTVTAQHGARPASTSTPPYGSAGQGNVPPTPYGGGFGSVPPRGPAPVPTPVPVPKSKPNGPGAPAVAITAGLALLVGGTLKALDAGNVIDLGDSANAVVWASGAAVLGLGILLSGLRGKTSGILGFFAVAALIVGGIFNTVPNGDRFRFQNADWNPVSIEQAREGFQITGGRGTVDLTGLNLNPPLGTDVVVPLDVTASNVTVIIPGTVPVDVRADMTLGNLNEGADSRSGITSRQSSYNSDKPGARVILQIDGTVSNITIQEGN
ncbi:PspC domain-containing protein [Arthrobacter sp. ZGTC131]|uniref:PspC domain-containing protein n=1 Tax=Arthrobacter sp. ZGTC131 TaxID=2058898 RepID=UPI0021580938|nr:PspC domain-containing protein [Arthrobacter sp. ZGTC131]